jgi:hypothetical protein
LHPSLRRWKWRIESRRDAAYEDERSGADDRRLSIRRTLRVRFLILFLAVALPGCTAPKAAPRCDLSASREIAFTEPEARDVVETRSLGADCGAAVTIFVLRSHEGIPLWAWAAPAYPVFGDAFAPRPDPDGPTRDEMRVFLKRWAAAEVARTGAAPEWSESLPTPLDRVTYEDVRARDVPMVCHLAGVARHVCIYWESGAAGAGELYVREPPTPETVEPTSARMDRKWRNSE